MSVISELEVLINGNNAGLMRGLREGENAVDGFAAGFSQRLQDIGGGLTRLGGQITMITAPLGIALGAATSAAMDFEEAMTNSFAVLGVNPGSDRWVDLSDTIQDIGKNAREGPQAVAAAFYDIVGGVADATTHIAILEQAIATSEAGAASLTGTTSALIAVMNAYGFSAEEASTASDILTQIVAKGVGTMDEFATSLPQVATIAAQTGVSLDQLGAMMAYLTTKGSTAGEAATYLRQAIVSLLNPNAAMEDLLHRAGMASGSAALEMYGLAGTMGRLQRATGGSVDALAEAVGSVEALQAVMVINQPQFEGFLVNFQDTASGATDAARAIQQASAAFQFDVLKSQIQSLAISIGDALLPGINELIRQAIPLIEHVQEWIAANPQLAATIATVAGAALIAGPAIAAIGFAISGIGAAVAIVTGPIGIIVAALAGLALAYSTNFLGIKDTLNNFLNNAQQTFSLVQFYAEYYLGAIWDKVRPVWETLRDWFTGQLMPALTNTFENHIMPVIQQFSDTLSGIWEIVRPHLERLYNWFVTDGFPGILDFITNNVIPGINDLIDLVGGFWKWASPGLLKIADWFLNTGLPVIVSTVEDAIDTFEQLKFLWDYFTGNTAPVNLHPVTQPAAGTILPYDTPTSFGSAPKMGAGKNMAGKGGAGVYIENLILNGYQGTESKDEFQKMFADAYEAMVGA